MAVRAGKLDRRVTIQTLTESLDSGGFGDPTEAWADQVTVWAEVTPLSGNEPFLRSQTLSKATSKFRIRYNSGITITEAHRISFDSDTYNILYIEKLGKRGAEYWEIIGERVA